MGKVALIILLGGIVTLSMVTVNFQSKTTEARQTAVTSHVNNQSRNLCNSTVGMLLSTLADNPDYRTKTAQTRSLFDGTATYSVKNVFLPNVTDSVIQIKITGVYFGDTSTVEVYAREPSDAGFIPGTIKGAVTTNNPVETKGNLIVDGRDHDPSGNLISENGTLGIWTTSTLSQKGNSKIGSTNGVDFAPAKKVSGNSDYVLTNQTYPGGYPDTPDKVLGGASNGYAEGTLKSIAQSGANGSQYVTDPSLLTSPFEGVTYAELPSGDTWQSMSIQGDGILIVHNSAKNAIMKNLNSGTFKGLIIADDIIHIHADIIGAVVGLSPAPSEGNCIGNGNGTIKFSRQATMDATGKTKSGGKNGYGFAHQRLEVIHWYE